jgi:hypothetical protein
MWDVLSMARTNSIRGHQQRSLHAPCDVLGVPRALEVF